MASQVIAALVGTLVGAAIGIAGSWALQSERFRRADRDGIRERLAIVRGLRSDLFVARMVIESIVKRATLVQGTQFPTALWESHGHRLLGALNKEGEESLIQAFGRLWLSNGYLTLVKGEQPLSADLTPEIAQTLKQHR